MADDLTGALDSAATFGSPAMPVPVLWSDPDALPAGPLAFDTGSRETGAANAGATVRRLARRFFAEPGALSFKKIDSLLRGSDAEEIGAVLAACDFERCVIAPAFPKQGRLARDGRQGVAGPDGSWEALPADLASQLEAAGRPVARCRPGDAVPFGISFWDSGNDADLDAIVAAAAPFERLLWVGSAGLAAALARRFASAVAAAPLPHRAPILGLFGTDHPAMEAQLRAVADHRLAIEAGDRADVVADRLRSRGAAFVSARLPPATPRHAAANRIAAVFGTLVRALDPPGTLVVAGGETLRALCGALMAERLDVLGEVMPGIPRSTIVGGRWSGTPVVSKSGAFGAPDLLRTLVETEVSSDPGVRSS